MPTPGKLLFKAIVGSQAHGLATEKSDTDYHGVFLLPTSEILSLGGKTQQTSWIEGDEDDQSWELSHFLHLATKCNPTVLESFVAPLAISSPEGDAVRALFPYIWQPEAVRDAFIGYGLNQRKKFLDDKDARGPKYAVAYLRTLYQAEVLLSEGRLPIDMSKEEGKGRRVFETLKRWKAMERIDAVDFGEVIEVGKDQEAYVHEAYIFRQAREIGTTGFANLNRQQQDLKKVNDLLLEIRRNNW